MVRQNTLPATPSESDSTVALAQAIGTLLSAHGIACTGAELQSLTRTWLRLAPPLSP